VDQRTLTTNGASVSLEADNSDDEIEGDGKAVFMEFGTEDEEEEFVRLEDRGWKGFYKKIFKN
jgi:hypothetical protein